MEEIEVKILDINVGEVVEKLLDMGASKVFEGDIKAIYFSSPHYDLSKQNKILRLRQKGDIVELVTKTVISMSPAKIMKEDEVTVSDYKTTLTILKNLGYEVRKKQEKTRVTYAIDNTHFEFDTFPGIPTFLEIEAPTIEVLEDYVTRLGFTMNDAKPWRGSDVLRHYKKVK